MKIRYFYILLIILSASCATTRSQVTRCGFHSNIGLSYVSDEIFFNNPTCAFGIGGQINFGFLKAETFWRNNFTIQIGLNSIRRGSRFHMDYPSILSRREGFYKAWYIQVPILACWRSELPFQKVSRHYINFCIGPTLNMALYGKMHDEQHSQRYSSPLVNFDNNYTEKDSLFNHIRRCDIGMQLGLGYQIDNFTLDLIWDVGLICMRNVNEMLIYLDVRPEDKGNESPYPQNPKGYVGQMQAVSLCFGYQIPIKSHRKVIKNPFK